MSNKFCSNCDAKCCKHVAVEIDKPESEKDFENIKWFVCHKNVNVFVDDDGWYVEFLTPCEFLGENNKCMNYDDKPEICTDYNSDSCVFHDDYSEKHTFKSLKDVEDYIREKFKKE